jgi:hypothetical protein
MYGNHYVDLVLVLALARTDNTEVSIDLVIAM